MPGPLVILGPQRPTPNLPQTLATFPLLGPVVTITAGWRMDEADTEDLQRDIGPDAVSLPLYRWFDEVQSASEKMAEIYRQQQEQITELADLYRLRLEPACVVAAELLQRAEISSTHAGPELDHALGQIRELDSRLLDGITRTRRDFAPRLLEAAPPEARLRQEEAYALLRRASAIVIAGGHVAVLKNRLRFFDLLPAIHAAWSRGTAVVAWSAGAMVLGERIVLFHDDLPGVLPEHKGGGVHDTPSWPEVLDRGMGLVSDLVLLPHVRQRLNLENRTRISLLARRMSPLRCVGLECGAQLIREGRWWADKGGGKSALRLQADGGAHPLGSAE